MKKLSVLFLFLIFCGYVSANDFARLVGTWNYKVEWAPEGYDKGQMIFSLKDGKVAGEIKLQGYTIQVKNPEYVEGQYKFGVEIDYVYIPITLNLEGDTLKGRANTPEGNLPIMATKAKPESK